MKKIMLVIGSVSVAILSCLINLVLFWLTDEISFRYWRLNNIWLDIVQILPLVISTTILFVISTIVDYIAKRKNIWTKVQRNLFRVLADIFYLGLMLTIFQMCCARWEIGAEWGVGLFLAVTWYLTLGVTVVHLAVVAGLMFYDKNHKN